MIRKQQAFFKAYFILLWLCVLYRIVCLCFAQLQFPLWDRIVVAVTVATFFFSFSDMLRTRSYVQEYMTMKLDLLSEKYDSMMLRAQAMLTEDLKDNREEIKSAKNADSDISFERIGKAIKGNDSDSEVDTLKKWEHICDLVGFLFFFCIILFDALFKVLSPIQDILTIIAFTSVLYNNMIGEKSIIAINEKIRKRKETQERIVLAHEIIEAIKSKKEH